MDRHRAIDYPSHMIFVLVARDHPSIGFETMLWE